MFPLLELGARERRENALRKMPFLLLTKEAHTVGVCVLLCVVVVVSGGGGGGDVCVVDTTSTIITMQLLGIIN